MIKSVFEKWEEIEVEANKEDNFVSEYYLSAQTKTKVYFSIEKSIKVIYIEFDGKILENYECPKINGLNITKEKADYINSQKKYLKLFDDSKSEEIFIAFSSSLVDNLINTPTYFDAIDKFEDTIKYYKDYFSNKELKLSEEEEQGLCAELIQLEKYIDKFGDAVIKNWQGPNKNKRDFVFNDIAIEVKSTKNQTNPSIHISNENQLDSSYPSSLKELLLKVYILERDDNGFNLIDRANIVLSKISSIQNKKIFLSLLLTNKIDINVFKPRYRFTLQKELMYSVDDTFPVLAKNNIPKEIHDVKYYLSLGSLDKYKVGKENEWF